MGSYHRIRDKLILHLSSIPLCLPREGNTFPYVTRSSWHEPSYVVVREQSHHAHTHTPRNPVRRLPCYGYQPCEVSPLLLVQIAAVIRRTGWPKTANGTEENEHTPELVEGAENSASEASPPRSRNPAPPRILYMVNPGRDPRCAAGSRPTVSLPAIQRAAGQPIQIYRASRRSFSARARRRIARSAGSGIGHRG
jgi:hypothetical protein